MADEPETGSLFETAHDIADAAVEAPAVEAPAPPAQTDPKLALIDKFFPAVGDGGVDAHQPIRRFLIELVRMF
ncbi:MAG: hypothetical protein KGL39_05035 [Patescibacteria group bacterium]|nr:hypothetical protein [Patescibacteria group bacterium]